MPTKLLHLNAAANATKKILARAHYHASPSLRSGSSSSLDSGYASDPDTMDLLKRHSISLGKAKKDRSKSDDALPPFANLDIVVESPPLLSYGNPDDSSGALFSGQFLVKIPGKSQTFETIEVRLLSVTTLKKPVAHHCDECGGSKKELRKWNFAIEPTTLSPGEHKFPLSYLFGGNLPATTHSHYALIDYQLVATVKTQSGQVAKHSHAIDLQRAVRPGNERQSIRVFPPTNMTANVKISPVIYTNSEIPVSLRLAGIKTSTEKTEVRWRLRRLLWRIDEIQKISTPACPKHRSKIPEGQTGVKHEEIKSVGEGEVHWNKTPWKTDMSAGEINAEFVASMQPKHRPIVGVRADDIHLQVYHHLVIEMIVVEEYVQKKNPTRATPTGSARILRSQFPLSVTNRAGMGVAWDEETPPVYQDVPPSPPGYQAGSAQPTTPGLSQTTEISMADIGEHIEDFHLGEPHDLARHTGLASASTVTRRSSSESTGAPRRHVGFSEDDLLQEPPEYFRRNDEDVEDDVDIQVGSGSAAGR